VIEHAQRTDEHHALYTALETSVDHISGSGDGATLEIRRAALHRSSNMKDSAYPGDEDIDVLRIAKVAGNIVDFRQRFLGNSADASSHFHTLLNQSAQ
jgi:hypothetical protein